MFLMDMPAENYLPRPAPLFCPSKIVLAKGSNSTDKRREFAQKICAAYPDAEVIEAFDLPHNRIDLKEADLLRLHDRGKHTLVLSERRSGMGFSKEKGNSCPNYWHFSPYGFCPYGCQYCYLPGTPGVRFSPTVKIFLNLPEILAEVDQTAARLERPTAFYLGKLQDGLALEPLSGYARLMIPFFARHPYARLVILTKSTNVENILDLEHAGKTIMSWTLNAPEVGRRFEKNTPDVMDRVESMRRCAEVGYAVRAVVLPIIPATGWEDIYGRFLSVLLSSVSLSRITLGSICSYPEAQRLMALKMSKNNEISMLLDQSTR